MREEAGGRQSANSRYLKDILLRLLGRCGLLLLYFRGRERLISMRGGGAALVGTDGLPLPSPLLMVRVAGTADTSWFLESGQMADKAIRDVLERSGLPIDALSAILDFGCGCGRVLRRWQNLDVRVCGSDISAAAVKWCRKYLPFVDASVNQLNPPLIYQDESFDLVYALSVLTHLPVKSQIAWRDEFARVLRPGGRLLLSLHGDAYLERLSPEERRRYKGGACVVRWTEAAGSNLCATFHPTAFVRDRLAAGWELLEHIPCGALGNPVQDLVVLRKPGSQPPAE